MVCLCSAECVLTTRGERRRLGRFRAGSSTASMEQLPQSMAKPEYLTAPLKTDKMPPGVPFSVGNEAAERFSYYGMNSILLVFMTTSLRDAEGNLAVMSEAQANARYHLFVSCVYFLPLLGAFLADAVLGKFRAILYLSIAYCFGHLALAIDHTRLGLVIGLGLIAL